MPVGLGSMTFFFVLKLKVERTRSFAILGPFLIHTHVISWCLMLFDVCSLFKQHLREAADIVMHVGLGAHEKSIPFFLPFPASYVIVLL